MSFQIILLVKQLAPVQPGPSQTPLGALYAPLPLVSIYSSKGSGGAVLLQFALAPSFRQPSLFLSAKGSPKSVKGSVPSYKPLPLRSLNVSSPITPANTVTQPLRGLTEPSIAMAAGNVPFVK